MKQALLEDRINCYQRVTNPKVKKEMEINYNDKND